MRIFIFSDDLKSCIKTEDDLHSELRRKSEEIDDEIVELMYDMWNNEKQLASLYDQQERIDEYLLKYDI